jgi:hypothetical protein
MRGAVFGSFLVGLSGCMSVSVPKDMDIGQTPADCVGKFGLQQDGRWHVCTLDESIIGTYRKMRVTFTLDSAGHTYVRRRDVYAKPGELCSGPLAACIDGGRVLSCEVYPRIQNRHSSLLQSAALRVDARGDRPRGIQNE